MPPGSFRLIILMSNSNRNIDISREKNPTCFHLDFLDSQRSSFCSPVFSWRNIPEIPITTGSSPSLAPRTSYVSAASTMAAFVAPSLKGFSVTPATTSAPTTPALQGPGWTAEGLWLNDVEWISAILMDIYIQYNIYYWYIDVYNYNTIYTTDILRYE